MGSLFRIFFMWLIALYFDYFGMLMAPCFDVVEASFGLVIQWVSTFFYCFVNFFYGFIIEEKVIYNQVKLFYI